MRCVQRAMMGKSTTPAFKHTKNDGPSDKDKLKRILWLFVNAETKPHRVNQYNQRAFGKFNNYCKLFSIKWFERSFQLCQADTAAMSHRSWESFLQLSSDKVNLVLRGRFEKNKGRWGKVLATSQN